MRPFEKITAQIKLFIHHVSGLTKATRNKYTVNCGLVHNTTLTYHGCYPQEELTMILIDVFLKEFVLAKVHSA